jgi:hypothetical protein
MSGGTASNLSHDYRAQGKDLNKEPPKYEAVQFA